MSGIDQGRQHLQEQITKLDDLIKFLQKLTESQKTDSELPKSVWKEFLKFNRDFISFEFQSSTLRSDLKLDLDLVEEGIEGFFATVWQVQEDKDRAVEDFIFKEEGFFYLNLTQSQMLLAEVTANLIFPILIRPRLQDVFLAIHAYLHSLESFCFFLKPFLEKYYSELVKEDSEKFNKEIYDKFLNQLEPNLRSIFKAYVDFDLRHAAAHATFTVNLFDGSITLRKQRKNKDPKMILISFQELVQKLFALQDLFRVVYLVWSRHLFDFFEDALKSEEDSRVKNGENQFRHFLSSFNAEYVLNSIEGIKTMLMSLLKLSIPPSLLEKACERIVQKYQALPFEHQGIQITKSLITNTMQVLNVAPDRTLPQNCQPGPWQQIPDGLDKRIRLTSGGNISVAEVLSEMLAEVGIVQVAEDMDPKTKKIIKKTRLFQNWSW